MMNLGSFWRYVLNNFIFCQIFFCRYVNILLGMLHYQKQKEIMPLPLKLSSIGYLKNNTAPHLINIAKNNLNDDQMVKHYK